MKIVAEISGNHGGFIEKARELIQVAALCGCDYAKFQYYNPRDMYDLENAALYSRLAVPREWLHDLFDTAERAGIGLFASVFSSDGVSDLLEFSPPYFKLASPQSTWLPTVVYKEIIETIPADTNVIFSADELDLDRMANIVGSRGLPLYCPPGHPPTITDTSLIESVDYHCFHGFSDHTPDLLAPLAFAQTGMSMIEKHLRLDDNCVDAAFSATPQTMAALCRLTK